MSRINRWSTRVLVLGALMLLGAGLIPPALGQSAPDATYHLDWVAVGEVSGGTSVSANYHLSATVGQMGAGTRSESAHYALCVGFPCGAATGYRVYLPLAMRS